MVRLMADYSSSGLWCQACGSMLEPCDLALALELQEAIAQWVGDWDRAMLNTGEAPPTHNQQGLALTQQLVRYAACTLFIESDCAADGQSMWESPGK